MIEKAFSGWEKACRVIAVLCLGIMFTTNIFNIILRGLFNYSLVWVFPLTIFLFMWMTFFGAYVIYRQKREITVDFIYNHLPETSRKVITLVSNILIMALMILILWHAPRLIYAQLSPMQVLRIPRYFQAVPLFLFCIVLSFDFLYETVKLIRGDRSSYTVQQ
jgi:TRAP-type C4-dicarboxylate transport system permease small subunit